MLERRRGPRSRGSVCQLRGNLGGGETGVETDQASFCYAFVRLRKGTCINVPTLFTPPLIQPCFPSSDNLSADHVQRNARRINARVARGVAGQAQHIAQLHQHVGRGVLPAEHGNEEPRPVEQVQQGVAASVV
eukprot:12696996-Heterocapsa_arctica.AAC.1